MIYIDAREGLSGDMLLAAMLGLLEDDRRADAIEKISDAARAARVDFHFTEVDEAGEGGWSVSCSGTETTGERRSYEEAASMMELMGRSSRSSDTAVGMKILDELFSAEAAVHGKPVSEVHLHEVGRASAILNMFGTGLVHSMLTKAGSGEFVCSTIVTGKGIVVIAHGAVRVPAPACKKLLEGLKHETGPDQGERATPTGLAAARVLMSSQSDEIPARYQKRSIGFGTRRFGGRLGRTTLFWH